MEDGVRRFVVDFSGGRLADIRDVNSITAEIEASEGEVGSALRQRNAFTGGIRLTFELVPAGDTSEIRATLRDGGETLTETWSYQWRR